MRSFIEEFMRRLSAAGSWVAVLGAVAMLGIGAPVAVTIPYSVGIAVPKDKPKFQEAVMDAMNEIYKSGDQAALLKKWELDPNNLKEPGLLTVK